MIARKVLYAKWHIAVWRHPRFLNDDFETAFIIAMQKENKTIQTVIAIVFHKYAYVRVCLGSNPELCIQHHEHLSNEQSVRWN